MTLWQSGMDFFSSVSARYYAVARAITDSSDCPIAYAYTLLSMCRDLIQCPTPASNHAPGVGCSKGLLSEMGGGLESCRRSSRAKGSGAHLGVTGDQSPQKDVQTLRAQTLGPHLTVATFSCPPFHVPSDSSSFVKRSLALRTLLLWVFRGSRARSLHLARRWVSRAFHRWVSSTFRCTCVACVCKSTLSLGAIS